MRKIEVEFICYTPFNCIIVEINGVEHNYELPNNNTS